MVRISLPFGKLLFVSAELSLTIRTSVDLPLFWMNGPVDHLPVSSRSLKSSREFYAMYQELKPETLPKRQSHWPQTRKRGSKKEDCLLQIGLF